MTESEKYRYILDNSLKCSSVGFLVGTTISMVLFRSIGARVALTSLTSGIGLGVSYADARYVLGHDVVTHDSWKATVSPAATAAD